MIRFVDSEIADVFLSSLYYTPALGARIYTLYKIFEENGKSACFWVQMDEIGMGTAAISLYGGYINVCAGAGSDLDELGEFLGFLNASLISAPNAASAAFPPWANINASYQMIYDGGAPNAPRCCAEPKLSDVYALLCRADKDFASATDWEGWYVHTSHIIRHGLGFCVGIYKDGALVSTGGVYGMNGRYALIGGVATLPEYRRKGHGQMITGYLAGRCVDFGRVPVLLTANERLARWYGDMGFKALDCDILEAVYE